MNCSQPQFLWKAVAMVVYNLFSILFSWFIVSFHQLWEFKSFYLKHIVSCRKINVKTSVLQLYCCLGWSTLPCSYFVISYMQYFYIQCANANEIKFSFCSFSDLRNYQCIFRLMCWILVQWILFSIARIQLKTINVCLEMCMSKEMWKSERINVQ